MSNNQTVESRALPLSNVPVIQLDASLKKALDKMTEHRLGIALIVGSDNKLVGVLTDGDLRRLLLGHQSPLPELLITPAINFGTRTPSVILASASVTEAATVMAQKEIWDLPVVDGSGKLIGLVHRHNLN
ncbi:arabinose-5-phosphate isomerase [Candidatus Planktophila dulcis]|uniref:Arabinose-5-phosphate isomerase n=1 Tax=Candidatus Planktophila dulcis TaxID=1884914 RepID=A0AAC9YT29_9ACTN|nr:arabinose-5-phosphate isomerase [Candidatus Planktophila dulcis]